MSIHHKNQSLDRYLINSLPLCGKTASIRRQYAKNFSSTGVFPMVETNLTITAQQDKDGSIELVDPTGIPGNEEGIPIVPLA